MLKRAVILSLQLVLSAFFTYELLYPNIYAYWGLIDDHEIITYLGPDSRMELAEYPSKLLKSEAAAPFKGIAVARYRPAYYSIRLLETAAWDDNPRLWYLFRLVLTGASIFIAWYLLAKPFGLIFSGISCFALFTETYWADIWTRLGPAEHYAFFGTALFCLSFYKIWKGRSGLWWPLLALGAIVSFGSKENFLILAPAAAYLFYRKKQLRLIPVISCAFILLSGVFIAGEIILYLFGTGTDIYGASVNPKNRFLSKLLETESILAFVPLFASSLLFAAARKFPAVFTQKFSFEAGKKIRAIFLAQFFLFTIWLSQFFFYNGELPADNRYDFPGMFIFGLSYLILLYIPLYVTGSNKKIRTAALAVFGFLVVYSHSWDNFIYIQTTAVNNLRKTGDFTKNAVKIIKALRAAPSTPVIFDSFTNGDYEPVTSFSVYLKTFGVTNPVTLFFEERHAVDITKPITAMCTRLMEKIEKEGAPSSDHRLGFAPYAPPAGDCFVVSFSGDSKLDCTDLGKIW